MVLKPPFKNIQSTSFTFSEPFLSSAVFTERCWRWVTSSLAMSDKDQSVSSFVTRQPFTIEFVTSYLQTKTDKESLFCVIFWTTEVNDSPWRKPLFWACSPGLRGKNWNNGIHPEHPYLRWCRHTCSFAATSAACQVMLTCFRDII